ncbi:hypothetical protein [Arcobacter sp. YIC-310]|uniref:hypothetical protein n=1 Tax=Arcobacter sp. YIC-310 TaxID=3376632 RepID=UPI003C14AC9C
MKSEKKFEYDYFDREGNLDKSSLNNWRIGYFVLSSILVFIAYTYVFAFIVIGQNPFVDFASTFENLKIMAIFIASTEFKIHQIIYLSLSLILSYFIFQLHFKDMQTKASHQKKLHQLGLGQYYLEKIDKSKDWYYYKLSPNGTIAYDRFLSSANNFKQLFNVPNVKIERDGEDKVIVKFQQKTPSLSALYKGSVLTMDEMDELVTDGASPKDFEIVSDCERTDFSSEFGENKSILGTQDIKGKPLFAPFAKTVGVLYGMCLVAGGIGSGKSFLGVNWVKTWFLPENYKNLGHVYIINLKQGSKDWRFLDGINKVTFVDIEDGIDAVLNTLKKAYILSTAKSKDNTNCGVETTEHSQDIVVIDEIHVLMMMIKDNTLPKPIRAKAEKCVYFIDKLSTQSRSSNLFIIGILQKATLDMIPNVFRSMVTFFLLLRADKITANILIDSETQLEFGVDSSTLTSGQFLMYDKDKRILKSGFAVEAVKEFNIDEINNYEETEALKEARKRIEKLTELTKIVIRLEMEEAEKEAESDDYKDEINSFDNLDKKKENLWIKAEEVYKAQLESKGDDTKEESKSEELNLDKKPSNLKNKKRRKVSHAKKRTLSEEEIKKYEDKKEAMKKRLLTRNKEKLEEESQKEVDLEESTIEDIEKKAKEALDESTLQQVEQEVKEKLNKENIQYSEDLTF